MKTLPARAARTVTAVAVCAALAFAAMPAAAQPGPWPEARVAIVDFQKAIDLSLRGKLARKDLQRSVTGHQQRIEQLHAELEKLEDDYKAKSLELEGDPWEEYKARFGKRVKDLRREGEDIQEQVALDERRLTEELLGELTVLVQRWAKKNGYNLVLEKRVSETAYQRVGLDVTEKIIEIYDSGALFEKEKP